MTTTPSTTPTAGTGSHHPGRALRERCGPVVHLPGSPEYDLHRTPWNVAVDQRPAAVAVPETVVSLAAVAREAAALGLGVAPQATGHGAGPLTGRDLSRTVLVRTHLLRGVHVDPTARTARVEAGAQWADVMAQALPHGLVALHGSAPDVGAVGYTLGGGLSWYARKHGLAAATLRAVELVTADGEFVRADSRQHQELLWACRGGGGSFGVVTTIEIDLVDVGSPYAGMMLWDADRAPEVLRAWAEWCRTAPEEVTTSFRVMRFPPLPELPPFLSGRAVALIDGAALLPEQDAAALLAPLRELSPELDTFAVGSPEAVMGMHMDPPAPTPAVGAGTVLAELSDAAVAAFLAQVGPGGETPVFLAELRHVGGAVARPTAAALSHVVGSHVVMCLEAAPTPQLYADGAAATQGVVDALEEWSTGGAFLNLAERAVDPVRAFGVQGLRRLSEVRRRYDPSGSVVASHQVPLDG